MLSPECMDLLNKIFNLDQAKRYVYVWRDSTRAAAPCTLHACRQPPWLPCLGLPLRVWRVVMMLCIVQAAFMPYVTSCLTQMGAHQLECCFCVCFVLCLYLWDCSITIPEIRQHPWFGKPLVPPYSLAMAELLAEQRDIDQQVGAAWKDASLCTAAAFCKPAHHQSCTAHTHTHACIPSAQVMGPDIASV